MPDGPPLRFKWRRALHDVIAAEGPERIEGAWWSEHSGHPAGNLARDYFRVEDKSGLRFWLFRAGLYRDLTREDVALGATRRAAWFLHGTLCVRRPMHPVLCKCVTSNSPAASNFSFLRGASHPEELMAQAARLGLAGLGLCDRNSVAGVVRAHLAKREQNLPLNITRARGWSSPTARPIFSPIRATAPAGAGSRACSRSAICAARKANAFCISTTCIAHAFGLEMVDLPYSRLRGMGGAKRGRMGGSTRNAAPLTRPHAGRGEKRTLAHRRPGRVRLAASMLYRGQDRARLSGSQRWRAKRDVPLIAINDVLYHHPDRRPLADVLTCIREKVDHRPRRPQARRQCRAASETAGGNGAAVPRRAGGDRGNAAL